MTDYIKELYYQETKLFHGPLDFGVLPDCLCHQRVYQECLSHLSSEAAEPLDSAVLQWLDSCNEASFRRGFQLGLRLMRWAEDDAPVPKP